MNEATQVMAPSTPVEIRPGLEVRLLYNLLSTEVILDRFGEDNPLLALFQGSDDEAPKPDDEEPKPRKFGREMAFMIAAGLLHEGATEDPALRVDFDAIDLRRLEPLDATDRLAARIMRMYETQTGELDTWPLVRAIARATDVANPLAACKCGHAYSAHCETRLSGSCKECACAEFEVPARTGKDDAPAVGASTGAASTTSPPPALAVAIESSAA